MSQKEVPKKWGNKILESDRVAWHFYNIKQRPLSNGENWSNLSYSILNKNDDYSPWKVGVYNSRNQL